MSANTSFHPGNASSPRSTVRRRPALPCGYEPPDYRVVPVRLADGTVLHVNADDLADPRYVNVRNLSPDGVPLPGRAGLQPRAVFHGAEVLGSPYYGTEYQPRHAMFAERGERRKGPDFKEVEPGDVVERLFQQAQRVGVHLTPHVAEALSLGDPRVIGYVAEMIAQMGGKPAVEPRYEGGEVRPGGTYTVNERGPEAVVRGDGRVEPLGDGRPSIMQVREPGYVLPVNPPPAAPAHGSGPKYSFESSPELQEGRALMRQIYADQEARNIAAARNAPTGEEKIKAAVNGAANLAKGAAGFVEDTAVGLGKMAGTMATVAAEPLNPIAMMQGLPMTRAAGQAALTGLASMGTSANHYLAGFTEPGKKMQGHLDQMRGELDKMQPGTNIDTWLKQHDKTLQQNLPAWYAGVRPFGDGQPTGDDIRMAGQRGLTNPEHKALAYRYLQTHDPKDWASLQRSLGTTAEELAVQQMGNEVMQSEGGQQFDKLYGKGASENMISTFDPINLATTLLPAGKALGVTKAVLGAGEGTIARTIAGNVVRSAPAAAGYGAVQEIRANPDIRGGDLAKGVLKNVAGVAGITAAAGVAAAGMKRRFGSGDKLNADPAPSAGEPPPKPNIPQDEVPEAFRNLPEPGPKGEVLYTYTREPWRGEIMETGPDQGRLWATVHPPGPWAYSTDAYNTALRAWRTGRRAPFVDWHSIEGAARDQFTKPLALGPLRGWKRAAGQNYTNVPGNMELPTGKILPATTNQKIRMLTDKAGSHAFDTAVTGTVGYGAAKMGEEWYKALFPNYGPRPPRSEEKSKP